MPSACVHLNIAYMLKEKLKIADIPQFHLGSISPDAVNLEGFAEENIRYAAHIRNRDYNVWKNDIAKFYEQNKDKLNKSFLLGFMVHIYTDIAWDELVQPGLFEYLRSAGTADEAFKKEKWAELYRLNSLIAQQDFYSQILKSLSTAECTGISTVSADLLERYRDYLAEDYQDKISNEKPNFLTLDMLEKTAAAVLKYVSDLIHNHQ